MFEASHVQHNIVSGYIQIVSDGHQLPAYWSHPELGGPFPGLVLIHDRWGLTPHIRAQARRFAEQGYYVIVPDLFNRQTATTPAQAQVLIDQVGEAVRAHITAALHALNTHHKCNSELGIIGWGFGAQAGLQTAIFREDVQALVIFYALPDDLTPAQLRLLACPLLALLAGQDPDLDSEQIETLRAILAETDPPHMIQVYASTARDFFNDSRPAFDPTAAEDAWHRALNFLNTQLAPGPDEIH